MSDLTKQDETLAGADEATTTGGDTEAPSIDTAETPTVGGDEVEGGGDEVTSPKAPDADDPEAPRDEANSGVNEVPSASLAVRKMDDGTTPVDTVEAVISPDDVHPGEVVIRHHILLDDDDKPTPIVLAACVDPHDAAMVRKGEGDEAGKWFVLLGTADFDGPAAAAIRAEAEAAGVEVIDEGPLSEEDEARAISAMMAQQGMVMVNV